MSKFGLCHIIFQPMEKKSTFTIGLPLLISIVFHVVLLLLIGGVILYPGYVSKQNFLGAMMPASQEEIEMPPPDDTFLVEPELGGGGDGGNSEDSYLSTSPMDEVADITFDTDVITSPISNPSFSMPKASSGNIADALGSGMLGEGGGSGGGKGGGIGKGIGKGVFTGLIGGLQVEASKLGVVMDNSGSMRNYHGKLIQHIKENFPVAKITCAGGAHWQGNEVDKKDSVFKDKGIIVDVKELPDNNDMNPFLKGASHPTYGQAMGVAITAMVLLEDIDALYIFGDFNQMKASDYGKPGDPLVEKFSKELFKQFVKEAKKKKIKIYLHILAKSEEKYFNTEAGKAEGTQNFINFVKESGGDYIIGPLK